MIDFDHIPQALRYPGAYIEIDPSGAGVGSELPAVLLVGQKLATGTAAAGEVVAVASVADAEAKAGVGSMLAQMAAAYRAVDPVFDLYMLPYSDNASGVAAAGTLTVSVQPANSGTLALYIAGRLVSVGIVGSSVVGSGVGQNTSQVATAVADAVNVAVGLPVTASASGNVVTFAARHKGTCGNSIDLRLNVYGESTPGGLGVSLAAMSGGSGDPAPGDLSQILGGRRYHYVALGLNDNATMAAWHLESQRRYLPPFQAGFRAFAALRGDYTAAVTYGQSKNAEHISTLALGLNPTSTWQAAATVCAAAGPALRNNPVRSLEDVALPGMVGVSNFDWTQANSLLFKGMSIMSIARDGSCTIKRLVSMYQTKPDGSADDAYLDINAAEAMDRIREEQRFAARRAFVGTAAAKSKEGYKPGLRITTEDDVRALLLTVYSETLLREYGWVQNYEFYKANLVVEQDTNNANRFNFADKPVLLSPFYVLAGRSSFRKKAVA